MSTAIESFNLCAHLSLNGESEHFQITDEGPAWIRETRRLIFLNAKMPDPGVAIAEKGSESE